MDYIRVIENETSVKKIGVFSEPLKTRYGIADMIVRPQYSVFDWGKMPMPEGKEIDNRSLVVVTAYNFELAEAEGIETHYLAAIDENGKTFNIDDMKKSSKIPAGIKVKFVNKFLPKFENGGYDYSIFQNPPANNYIVPLEFIFRNELPPESSLWKAFESDEFKLSDFGLPADIKPGDKLPHPILDYTSKFESKDNRYKSDQARMLAGISEKNWNEINQKTLVINRLLTEHAKEIGIEHQDGKIEYVTISDIYGHKYIVGDFAGTWHEDRWTKNINGKAFKISKQLERDFNLLLNKEWVKDCERAQVEAKEKGIHDWRPLVKIPPKPLEPEFFDHYNNITRAATNLWVGFDLFGASPLDEALIEGQKYFEDYKSRLQGT